MSTFGSFFPVYFLKWNQLETPEMKVTSSHAGGARKHFHFLPLSSLFGWVASHFRFLFALFLSVACLFPLRWYLDPAVLVSNSERSSARSTHVHIQSIFLAAQTDRLPNRGDVGWWARLGRRQRRRRDETQRRRRDVRLIRSGVHRPWIRRCSAAACRRKAWHLYRQRRSAAVDWQKELGWGSRSCS